MERILALAFLLALLRSLAGCASAPKTDYTFSFQGPDSDYETVLAAAADWNSCGVVHVTVTRDGEGIPIGVSNALADADDEGETSDLSGDPDWIHYRPGKAFVVKHEMGHAFGLPHYGLGLMHHRILADNVGPEECRRLEER